MIVRRNAERVRPCGHGGAYGLVPLGQGSAQAFRDPLGIDRTVEAQAIDGFGQGEAAGFQRILGGADGKTACLVEVALVLIHPTLEAEQDI